jgi:hypothetical protein
MDFTNWGAWASDAFTNPTPNVQLHINVLGTDDVVVAQAQAVIEGTDVFTATGSSRRDPSDPVSYETGAKLAIGRAVRQLGRNILHDGQDLVRAQDVIKKTQIAAAEAARKRKATKAAAAKKAATKKVAAKVA